MLAFPSESSDPGISVAFKNWHHDRQPPHTGRLLVADSEKRAVCNCLDKTVAQSAGRYTKGPGSIGVGDQLDNVRARGPRMDQRAAERFEKLAVCGMPGSLQFGARRSFVFDNAVVAKLFAANAIDICLGADLAFYRSFICKCFREGNNCNCDDRKFQELHCSFPLPLSGLGR